MQSTDLQTLIKLLAKLPGLGPRSGRRVALHLLKYREELMRPLSQSLAATAANIRVCSSCGNLDTSDLCAICTDQRRDTSLLCIVEGVADLWALERSSAFKGHYHVLGGTLSALEGVSPQDLKIPDLIRRIERQNVREVILALNATVEGQTTAHYLADRLMEIGVEISALAHGVPLGGELDYLDDGTLTMALSARRPV